MRREQVAVGVLVAHRLDVGVPLQAGPRLVAGDHGNLGNGLAHLEQVADSLVSQVVKMQVLDTQHLAGLYADQIEADRKEISRLKQDNNNLRQKLNSRRSERTPAGGNE